MKAEVRFVPGQEGSDNNIRYKTKDFWALFVDGKSLLTTGNPNNEVMLQEIAQEINDKQPEKLWLVYEGTFESPRALFFQHHDAQYFASSNQAYLVKSWPEEKTDG